jgi:3D (Asp-Asp-Asp) domain-containing protein
MNKLLPLLLLTPIASGSMGVFYKPCGPTSKEEYKVVTLTTYTIERNQTDSNPLETASGYILDKKNPAKHKVIAISRDLKKKFKFSDSVQVTNAGSYDGVYVVEDIMNRRFKDRIDILINPNDKGTLLLNVKIKQL